MMHRAAQPSMMMPRANTSYFRPMPTRAATQWHAGYAQRRAGMMMSRTFHDAHAVHGLMVPQHRMRQRFAASTMVRHDVRSLRRHSLAYAPFYGYGSTLAYDDEQSYGYADDYGNDYATSGDYGTSAYADSRFRPGFLAFIAGESGSSVATDAYAPAPVRDYSIYSTRPRCSCY
jgi:hypothetical protein